VSRLRYFAKTRGLLAASTSARATHPVLPPDLSEGKIRVTVSTLRGLTACLTIRLLNVTWLRAKLIAAIQTDRGKPLA
jgi:hypothetical protein